MRPGNASHPGYREEWHQFEPFFLFFSSFFLLLPIQLHKTETDRKC